MSKRKKIRRVFIIVFLFLFNINIVFAQEFKIIPYRALKDTSRHHFKEVSKCKALEKEIDEKVETLRKSRFYTLLIPYLIVRYEDLSLLKEECNRCYSDDPAASQECIREFYTPTKRLLNVRYLSEGRCEEIIKDATVKRICKAVKRKKCESLQEPDRSICSAIVNIDPEKLYYARTRAKRTSSGRISKSQIYREVAVYVGYKYYNASPCERYAKNLSLTDMLGCKILFSADPEEELEKILRDLAIFDISKKRGEPQLCECIRDRNIRKCCEDREINRLDEILRGIRD